MTRGLAFVGSADGLLQKTRHCNHFIVKTRLKALHKIQLSLIGQKTITCKDNQFLTYLWRNGKYEK